MEFKKKSMVDVQTRKGLDEAASYVSKTWFPINTGVLKSVQTKLNQKMYHNGLELFHDLRADQALLTYALRELGNVVKSEESAVDLQQLLRSMELEHLREIFSRSPDQISGHRLDPTMKPQILRLKQSLISTTTVESLAQKSKGNVDVAFITASVRQLGLNLVAWNYPRIYSKAIASLSPDNDDLDEALMKVLGYSPLQLGVHVSLGWHQSPFMEAALGGEGDEPQGLTPTAIAEALSYRDMCELAEDLARISDPEHFPHSAQRASSVLEQIQRRLGPQGLQSIKTRLDSQTSGFQDLVPNIFKFDFSPERSEQAAHQHYSERLKKENQFLSRCPEEIQQLFKPVYDQLQPGAVSTTAINTLVTEVLPALGFPRGCVYLVDQKKMMVVPILRIGDTSIERFRTVACSSVDTTNHPVVMALSYTTPIIQENVFVNGQHVCHVTGTFGNKEKTGVLYLEMTSALSEDARQTPLLYFKAARECLSGCLNLGGNP